VMDTDFVSPPSSPNPILKTSLRGTGVRASSAKSTNHSDEEDEGDNKGVYDSSHKKRVPSW
jgi:hypothetical protein